MNLFDLSADYTQYNKIKHGENLFCSYFPCLTRLAHSVAWMMFSTSTARTTPPRLRPISLRSYPTSGPSTAHCSNTRENGENHAIKTLVPARPCSTSIFARSLCRGRDIAGLSKFSEMFGKQCRMRSVFPLETLQSEGR